jgi:hypothetical protein
LALAADCWRMTAMRKLSEHTRPHHYFQLAVNPGADRFGQHDRVSEDLSGPIVLDAIVQNRKYGRSDSVGVVVVREGKNLKGWMLGLVLGTIGRRVLEKAFENSVKAIEARSGRCIMSRVPVPSNSLFGVNKFDLD